MGRRVVVLAGLALAFLFGPAPSAEAVGAGACTIGGTITFTASEQAPGQGTWSIAPGVIECRGQFNTYEYMVRNGEFTGSGTYTAPAAEVGCFRELGTGSVDYWIHTDKQDIHVVEPYAFLLSGAGAFTTPTLRGLFQIANYEDGNCLTGPVTRASFLAQVTLARGSLADWTL